MLLETTIQDYTTVNLHWLHFTNSTPLLLRYFGAFDARSVHRKTSITLHYIKNLYSVAIQKMSRGSENTKNI